MKAFPQHHQISEEDEGINLRDFFASKVDIPWNAVINSLNLKGIKDEEITLRIIADFRASYKYGEADAMLKARMPHELDKGTPIAFSDHLTNSGYQSIGSDLVRYPNGGIGSINDLFDEWNKTQSI